MSVFLYRQLNYLRIILMLAQNVVGLDSPDCVTLLSLQVICGARLISRCVANFFWFTCSYCDSHEVFSMFVTAMFYIYDLLGSILV